MRKEWTIFGNTSVPCIHGDSNKDAGVYIDGLAKDGKEVLALLEVHCNLCLVQKLMFGDEAQARKACDDCGTYTWTKGPRTKDIVAEMFDGDKAPVKPSTPTDTPIRDMMGHTTRSYLLVQFESIIGNPTKAKLLTQAIEDYAPTTKYRSLDLVEKARELLAFGIKLEDVFETLVQIVNTPKKGKLVSSSKPTTFKASCMGITPDTDSLADIVAEELLRVRIQKIDDKSRFILDIIEREIDKKIKAAS